MNPPRSKTKRRVTALCISKLIAEWQQGPRTVYELAEVSGLHHKTVARYVNSIHDEHAAHIAEWEEDSRGYRTIPAYVLAPGKDVKRPCQDVNGRKAKYRAKQAMLRTLAALRGKVTA